MAARPYSGRMIRHTVAFRLRHPEGSEAERAFLDAAFELAGIPGVERFERLRQVGTKNRFRFALSMEFADEVAYAAYDGHPTHRAFVERRWATEVEDFLELDYVPLA